MPRVAITDTEIREILLKTAREAFLADGIRGTEMKAIAERSGLSRSTVYRYAADKSRLAFLVVEQEMKELVAEAMASGEDPAHSGYERLSAFCSRLLDAASSRPRALRLIVEFDSIYTGDYPEIPEARDYIITMQRLHNNTVRLVLDGLADRSLTNIPDASVFAAMTANTIFGLALRILPREAHYVEEHKSGARAIIDEAIRVILSAVKA